MKDLRPVERIESRIYLIRGQKVMLDKDLAELYGVQTFNLNKAVKRNFERFPVDFMFQITAEEAKNLTFQIGIPSLTSQIAISSLPAGKAGWGGRRTLPYAFTEQGVSMLSSVLRSRRAIMVNISIMRAFVRFKQFLGAHKEIESKLDRLEDKFGKHLKKHDEEIQLIFEAIRKMLAVEEKPRRRIGFMR